jgi:hypothetical protein
VSEIPFCSSSRTLALLSLQKGKKPVKSKGQRAFDFDFDVNGFLPF